MDNNDPSDQKPANPSLAQLLDSNHLVSHYKKKFLEANHLQNFFRRFQWVPPGHFYSPIVDLDTFEGTSCLPKSYTELGINFDQDQQNTLAGALIQDPVAKKISAGSDRYTPKNDAFNITDAYFLSAMLRHLRPKRVVEIGSGYSSAVMLDTADATPELAQTSFTFIDPYCDLLRSLLKPNDSDFVEIRPEALQHTDLEAILSLGENDLLFVDSTHVLKTNSDVNFYYTHVLPNLSKGVFVHFHDIFVDFEYPTPWIEEGRSWNESYALRNFLQFNDRFAVRLFIDHLKVHGSFQLDPSGGSIYLEVR